VFGIVKKIWTDAALCPVCKAMPAGFLPLDNYYRLNANKHGYPHFGKCEMTAQKTYTCVACGASDRERLYACWMRMQIEAGMLTRKTNVLHFAPEASLGRLVKELFDEVDTADLLMSGCDYAADLMNLPFEDNRYDFFLCSHVLEHVESDDRAIEELFRVLKPGGCGILMAPIALRLKKTYEDNSMVDEADRWRCFGQNDHVRLYAHDDYVQKIESKGFRVSQLGVAFFGKKTFRRLGLKKSSILYVVHK